MIFDNALAIVINADAVSLHQSVEWGMRGLQSAFPRLKDPFTIEDFGRRHEILELLVRLYNFCTRLVGLNHIRSTYMPHLDADVDGLAFLSRRHWVPRYLQENLMNRLFADYNPDDEEDRVN